MSVKIRARLEPTDDVAVNQLARVSMIRDGEVEFSMSPVVMAPGGKMLDHPDKRKEFIRQSAISISSTTIEAPYGSSSLESISKAVWVAAKALWDAKPEDC